ncbi:hypothetical protein GCM10027200_72900 [Lentzea nigeriaca]
MVLFRPGPRSLHTARPREKPRPEIKDTTDAIVRVNAVTITTGLFDTAYEVFESAGDGGALKVVLRA